MLTINQIEAFEFLMKKANVDYNQPYRIKCDLFNGLFIIENSNNELSIDYKDKNGEWETYILTEYEDDRILNILFYHSNDISSLFWKPYIEQKYYYVNNTLNNKYYVETSIWKDSMKDRALFLMGNCFKTPEDARNNIYKIIDIYEKSITGCIKTLVDLSKEED